MKISSIDSSKLNDELIKKIFFNIKKENYEYADYLVIYGCHIKDSENFCNKFITYCKNKNSLENIKCPDELPFFNILKIYLQRQIIFYKCQKYVFQR